VCRIDNRALFEVPALLARLLPAQAVRAPEPALSSL